MPFRRLLTVLPLALAPVLIQVAAPPAAHAAQWFLTTNGDGTGYGEAGGAANFPDRDTVRISGTVNDYCGSGGGDGRGIYVRLRVITRSDTGNYTTHHEGVIGSDTNGCGSTPVDFGPTAFSYRHRIHYIEIRLCEEDREASGTTCLASGGVETIRNPN